MSLMFALIQLMFLCVTLYLHRDQSRGGLILHPPLRHFFRFWLWFCSGTVTRQWVAVHRRHHAFAGESGDPRPRGPVVFGIRRVLLQGYELYVAAAGNPRILANYGRGTPDDWLERHLYSRFPKAGILDETSASQARALKRLRGLCAESEGSGILALREFARRLPTYVPAESDCGPRRIGSSSGADVV